VNLKPLLSLVLLSVLLLCGSPIQAAQEAIAVNILVDLEQPRTNISPFIYGSNQDLPGFEGWSVRRLGGNRMTGYNWETNTSNAGSDWHHYSDLYLCDYFNIPKTSCGQPAIVLTHFHETSISMDAESLLTLQMAGFVAADTGNEVYEDEAAPSERWEPIQFVKNAPPDEQPDINDRIVYMDELLFFLTNKYGSASSDTGVWAYALDNEPGLWSETHPRLHPHDLSASELIDVTTQLATTIKEIDPDAAVFGPSLYGFWAFMTLQNAPDWKGIRASGDYTWFIDYYLDQMRFAEETTGIRLLDVLDVHWYSEAQGGGQRVVFNGAGNQDTQLARVQAPRTLWDESYREDSWIIDTAPQKIPLIPELQKSINTFYPGTKLAFSEWGFGGEDHISGGLAAADALGIFGKFGIFQASHWSTEDQSSYIVAAFQLFRNYDNQGGQFGDRSVFAETSDIENTSVYASVFEGDETKLHLILLNKNFEASVETEISIVGSHTYHSGQVWGFTGESSYIQAFEPITEIDSNQLKLIIPPLTALHVVLTADSQSSQFASLTWIIPVIIVTILILLLGLKLKKRSASKRQI
jgi:mannan endo-1,4-beta-mannosidase